MLRQLYRSGKVCVRLISSKPEAAFAVEQDTITNPLTKGNEAPKPEGWDTALPLSAIPGPKEIPLLGNYWRFFPHVGDLHDTGLIEFMKRFHQYGDIAALRGIGKTTVFVFDPNDIETVFRNDGVWPIRGELHSLTYYRKEIRNDIFEGMGTIATTNGKEWSDIRSKVNPILMQPRAIETYIPVMDEVGTDFLARIRYMMKQNENGEMPEDFDNEIYKWALESVGYVALDRRLGCLANDLPRDSETYKILESVNTFFESMLFFDGRPSYWRYFSSKRWRGYIAALDCITLTFYKYINEARQRYQGSYTSDQKSILQMLIDTDPKLAVPMGIDLLTGGVDTTGKTVANTLYLLALNKGPQEKLREELKTLLPKKDSKLTKEILRNASYLKAAVKEGQRLAPIVIGNQRTTTRDIVLKGYQIPKGTEVMLVNFVSLWSEEQYPRPQEFIPERWLRTNKGELSFKNANPFTFLPFGFGPRSCIGKRLALLETELLIAKIIRNFEVSWPHPPATFKSKMFYSISDPLKFRFKEIQD